MAKNQTLLLTTVFLTSVVIGLASVLALYPSPNRHVSGGPASGDPVMLRVGAGELWSAYGSNEAAEDSKYRGHRVAVSGWVAKVEKEGNQYAVGLVTMEAVGGEYVAGVVGLFGDSMQSELAKLKAGQLITVTITGKCLGKRKRATAPLGYLVLLEDCRIEK